MTIDEAKILLLRYRPNTADADDAQVAEALALAKRDPELTRWLAAHLAQQETLRARFQQITPPAGLKEQIVSEYRASRRRSASRLLWVSATALVVLLATVAIRWHPQPPPVPENTLAVFQNRMVRVALEGYDMDLVTNRLTSIREKLAQSHAPADFTLPPPLEHAELTGCAVREWQDAAVSLICFRTGKRLPPGSTSDLWLFVVDRSAVTNAPAPGAPQVAKVNRLMTATWTDRGKLYFLGVAGPEAEIRKYLD